MNKSEKTFHSGLGIFNIVWFFILSFMCLGSQFQLIFIFFLGVGYLILASGLFSRNAWVKKVFLYLIIPVSILTAFNVTVMGTTLVAPYFRMAPTEQILFTAIFIGTPFVLNAVYILESSTGKLIAVAGFVVMLALISCFASMVAAESRQRVMKHNLHQSSPRLSLVKDDYKYTPDVKTLAETGYELFKEGKIVGNFNGGYYTDPDPHIRGYEFWFNGKKVIVDRDHNGHHETIFMWRAENNALAYVGSIGTKGLYVDVGEGFEPYLGHYSDEPFLSMNK